jgi:hypothetical protein
MAIMDYHQRFHTTGPAFMDELKLRMKLVCASLLLAGALLASARPCAAFKFTSIAKDLDGDVLVANDKNCGFLVDKFLNELNLDQTQRVFILRSLAPLGPDIVRRVNPAEVTVLSDVVVVPATMPESLVANSKDDEAKSAATNSFHQTKSAVTNSDDGPESLVTTSDLVGLNNLAVTDLKHDKYASAIAKLIRAVNFAPTYTLARDNLAIAFNNYGLQLRNKPLEALKEFHKANFLDRTNPTTIANMEGIIKIIGKDPENSAVRAALGDHSAIEGDFIGAVIEYRAALQLKDDPQTRIKLRDVYRRLTPRDRALEDRSTTSCATAEPRWEVDRLPLKVYIGGSVEAARGGLVRDTIKSALSQWAQASNGAIRYQYTSNLAESDICFIEQLTDEHQWAQTCVDYHNGPIDRVKVILLESAVKSLPESRLKGLCLHEIGHVFGILKHSSDSRDAMSEMATDDNHPVVILSQRDKESMAALYARMPGQ